MKDDIPVGNNDCVVLGNVQEILIANGAYEAGRKAAEKDFKDAVVLLKELLDDGECEYVESCAESSGQRLCTFCAAKAFVESTDKKARGIE